MPYKYRVPVFIFAISMLTFLIFIVTEDLFWAKESFKTNPGKLYLGKIFIAISLSSLSSLISFVIVNTIDNSIKGLGGIIADWAENISEESDLSESGDAEIENEEISEIARSFKIATLQNKDREDNMVKELLSIHSSDTANSLQSFLFQVDLAQIRKFDVSIFPKVSENASCDFVSVMETSAGCIGMMAGFPHADAVEVGVKFRLDGVLSGLSKVNDVSAVDLISAAEFAVRKIRAQNMNLSMFLIESPSTNVLYQSFQENSMLLFKDGSVFPFSENKKKYYDFDQSPGEIASGKLSKGEFLVLITDRILSPLGITNNSLLTGIKEKVASNKNFLKSSKDLTLGIAKYIDSVAKTKGIGHILDILSIIVIRRK